MAGNTDLTTYQAIRQGIQITVRAVPTTLNGVGEELGFSLKVMRNLDALIAHSLDAAPDISILELNYAEVVPAPDPVNLELRRAIRLRRVSGAQVAQQLGVTPPVVSRWLSPDYPLTRHGRPAPHRRRAGDGRGSQAGAEAPGVRAESTSLPPLPLTPNLLRPTI